MAKSFTKKEIETAKADIISVLNRLYLRGVNTGMSGNISVKIDSRRMLITPSGIDKYRLSPDNISVVDFVDEKLLSGPKQSSEYRLHTHAYRLPLGIGAVVHPHPQYSLALVEALGSSALKIEDDEESKYYIGKVGVVGRMPFGSVELARAVAGKVLKEKDDVVIMEGHGTAGFGDTIYRALERVEALEHVAKKRAIGALLKRL